mgnify:FL=1
MRQQILLQWEGYKGGDLTNVTVMNQWIQQQIRSRLGGNQLFTKALHFTPQQHYVYDDDGSQIVRHVLRYETLQLDFHNLMDSYNLTIQLPDKSHGVNIARTSTVNKLDSLNDCAD